MRITITFTFVAALCCLAGAAGAAVAPSTPAALRSALAEVMKEHHVPGASYAVFNRDGTMLSETIGLADQERGVKATPSTLFRAGSITKSVTAIAIMRLVEQGRFTLQTPVSELLPDAPIDNPHAAASPVRVLHLLTHSAGLDDTHPKAFFAPQERRGQHLATAIANGQAFAVRWKPGTYQSYSNNGYVLPGAILEAHYRQPWDEIATRQVLQPLGMTSTVARMSVATRGAHAQGHTGDNARKTLMPFDQTQADGALWSTANDLARLGRFFLTDGASVPGLLKPDTVRAMKTPQGSLSTDAGLGHGNGLGQRSRIVDGEPWRGHSGGVLGAVASMHYHPQQQMGYVIMLNSENMMRKAEVQLARYIATQTGWKPAPPVLAPVALDVNGWYRSVNPRISLLGLPTFLLSAGYAEARGDRLMISSPLKGVGMRAELLHYGQGTLSDIDDGGKAVNGVILRDKGGAVSAIELDGVMMERSSMLGVVLPLASVLLAVPLLLTVPFGRRHALRNRWSRALPALALVVLVAGMFCASRLQLHILGEVRWQTFGVFLASTLFPLLAVLALVVNVRGWRSETATLAKWRSLLGALASVVLAGWLAAFGLVGFALWAW